MFVKNSLQIKEEGEETLSPLLGGAPFRRGKLEREMCDSCFEVDALNKKNFIYYD